MTSQPSTAGAGWQAALSRAESIFETGGRQVGSLAAILREKSTAAKAHVKDAAVDSEQQLTSEAATAANRAEQAVDDWGTRIGSWTADMGRRMQKAVAVAQEEAEDMVAEAQALAGKAP